MVRSFVSKANVVYKVEKDMTAEELDKLAPQAQVLVNVLNENGKSLTRAEFLEKLEGRINTKQPVEKILGYYQSKLVKEGIFSITEPEVLETAAKPAKGKGKEKEPEAVA